MALFHLALSYKQCILGLLTVFCIYIVWYQCLLYQTKQQQASLSAMDGYDIHDISIPSNTTWQLPPSTMAPPSNISQPIILPRNNLPTASPVMDKEHCMSLIGDDKLTFLRESGINKSSALRHPYPVYLFSYGGSGNTMTRTLLEYTTNIWTASIYHEHSLRRHGFQGEIPCNDSFNVLVIKAHPEHIKAHKLANPDTFLKVCLEFHLPMNRLQPVYTNMSAIFIVRDPWKALWALYQFHHGSGVKARKESSGHTQHLFLDAWDTPHWLWFLESSVSAWLATFRMMQLLDTYHHDYIVVKFEDLTNLKDTEIAVAAMIKMLKYLYSDEYYQEIEDTLMQRLRCLFPTLILDNYQRLGTMHRTKADPTLHVTMDVAYQFVIEHNLSVICRAWDRMKQYAAMYSYQNLPNAHCT